MGKKQTAAAKEKAPAKSSRSNARSIGIGLVLLLILTSGIFLYFRTAGNTIVPGKYHDFNVLLITLDTTRADHLPMYGYKNIETPALDRLAGSSFVFEDAVSHIPLTLPSHTSMMTGMLPIAHGVRDNAGFFLSPKTITLAKLLKGQGYSTGAFVSSFVLESRWGLNQGFDLYYDNFNLEEFKQLNPQEAQRPGGETELEFEHWLQENNTRKFFAWVHFYDPHDPYDPPEPFKSRYPDRPYDGEIAYMDDVIGKLMNKMEQLKLSDRTILVVTGDHGEGLGQHEEMTHAMFVYNTTQHVPLFIHIPGQRGKRIAGIARHMDIAPTVLQLLGINVVPEMQGSSLVPLMNGKKEEERIAYSESHYAELHYGWSPLASITTKQFKYIEAPKPELYDRFNDPDETRNLIQEKPAYARVLKSQLEEIIAKYGKKELQQPQKMDPETEERLRSLGYIGSTVQSTAESRKIDPKDKIQLAKGLQMASSETQKQNYEEALKYVLPVLQEDPAMTDGHFIAGVSYIGIKDYDKAIDELLKTLALRPDHTMALYNLGYTYQLKGENQEAEKWFLKVLQYEPQHLYSCIRLGHLYRAMDQPEKAKPYFLRAMKGYEDFLKTSRSDRAKSALHETLGEICFGAGELDQAEDHYRKAIDFTPDRETLHYNLALILEAKSNWTSAIKAYEQETEIDPSNFKAYNNLGLLYRRFNQMQNAAICFQKVVQLDPKDPRGYLLLASTYKQLGMEDEAEKILRGAPRE